MPSSPHGTAWVTTAGRVSLHQCAIAIRDEHGGAVPDHLDALLTLPGIGPYTARAVLVFAFEQPVGVVDVNAARVLGPSAMERRSTRRYADAATPLDDPWRWNQAMLDLGATVCTKRMPRCGDCPIAAHCAWRGDGRGPGCATRKPQSRFDGSDRQGRGRLSPPCAAADVGAPSDLADVMGWPDDPDRAERVARTVVADGLIKWEEPGNFFCLRR